MSRRAQADWLGLGFDAWSLGLEASAVIGLRTAKLALGGVAAQAEAALMIREKVEAVALLQARAITDGLGLTPEGAARATLAQLRRKVRANRRRLTRP